MNKVALWRVAVMGLALAFGLIYSLPNLFGELPAVQISTAKATLKVEPGLANELESLLNGQGDAPKARDVQWSATNTGNTVRVRFSSTDDQLRGRDLIEKTLNAQDAGRYVVAPGLVSSVPGWLESIRALPMFLGLDLRGGVHFLLEVDMAAATDKRLVSLQSEVRTALREAKLRSRGFAPREAGSPLVARFASAEEREAAATLIQRQFPEVQATPAIAGEFFNLSMVLKPEAAQKIRDQALVQNMSTLSKRINALGVAEPIVQRQGASRIVVQLPGVQDTARAKDILGRTATLEVRLVEDGPAALAAVASGQIPDDLQVLKDTNGSPILLRKEVVLTGDNLSDAQAGFASDNPGEAAVHLNLDSAGARIFREVTRANVGRRMAILLVERGRAEVITAPVIRGEIPGGRVQISGSMNTAEAADIALLLRAGALAAPMDIIEERLIGPSLGAENIQKGFEATAGGFIAIAVFILFYYSVFGLFSVAALVLNLLLLFALLSILQATLTLPGIAAIALTLGMAIDANVLINERIREELAAGASPQKAIAEGYDRAWATILDSNITTLIAGLALLIFGSGPVRGFAVVHCLGILTSIFSAVFFSRGLAGLVYGGRKLSRLRIG